MSGLLEMIGKLRAAVEQLTGERDAIKGHLNAHFEVTVELLGARAQLDETQARLDAGVRLQMET